MPKRYIKEKGELKLLPPKVALVYEGKFIQYCIQCTKEARDRQDDSLLVYHYVDSAINKR